jgi:hypothetical protein
LCGEDPSGTHSDDNRWRFEALKGGNKSLCDGSTTLLTGRKVGVGTIVLGLRFVASRIYYRRLIRLKLDCISEVGGNYQP